MLIRIARKLKQRKRTRNIIGNKGKANQKTIKEYLVSIWLCKVDVSTSDNVSSTKFFFSVPVFRGSCGGGGFLGNDDADDAIKT